MSRAYANINSFYKKSILNILNNNSRLFVRHYAESVVPSNNFNTANAANSMSCMNRNKRRLTPANHGAKPNNSIHRKSTSLKGLAGENGFKSLGLTPNQTRARLHQPGTPRTIAQINNIKYIE